MISFSAIREKNMEINVMNLKKEENKEDDKIELAKFYFINKKFELACEMFLDVFEKDQANYDVAYNIGLCFEALNETEKAVSYYKRVLSIKNDHKLATEHISKLVRIDD